MGITVKFVINTNFCIGNGKCCLVKFVPFPIQLSWYLSQISLLPILLHMRILYRLESIVTHDINYYKPFVNLGNIINYGNA